MSTAGVSKIVQNFALRPGCRQVACAGKRTQINSGRRHRSWARAVAAHRLPARHRLPCAPVKGAAMECMPLPQHLAAAARHPEQGSADAPEGGRHSPAARRRAQRMQVKGAKSRAEASAARRGRRLPSAGLRIDSAGRGDCGWQGRPRAPAPLRAAPHAVAPQHGVAGPHRHSAASPGPPRRASLAGRQRLPPASALSVLSSVGRRAAAWSPARAHARVALRHGI